MGAKRLTKIIAASVILIFVSAGTSHGQTEMKASAGGWQAGENSTSGRPEQVVKITGVRFSYPIVQKWIDEFAVAHPEIQVIIESRGSADPSQYDILVEGYEHHETVRQDRQYLYVARYALLPIASTKSSFAKKYGPAGLDREEIIQLFFYDPYADRDKSKQITTPFTVYTRLQKAAAPIVFSNYFGYEQKDIRGKTIAGSDEHLIKALQRDSTGVSFAPVPLIYDHVTSQVIPGITVIPVDLNGNDKVGEDESFYESLHTVVRRFDASTEKNLNNVPISYLHFSVDKKAASPEALVFLRWVITNSEKDLSDFGYLKPESGKTHSEEFKEFAARHIKQ